MKLSSMKIGNYPVTSPHLPVPPAWPAVHPSRGPAGLLQRASRSPLARSDSKPPFLPFVCPSNWGKLMKD